VAGGSDSYGYVSQAHLWATGRMREVLRLVDDLAPAIPGEALVPLAYNLAADRRTMVPVYSPGLPLVMAAFELTAGARAVFWVTPLLGGIAVGATYLLARRAGGRVAGAIAAVLLATSPAFLLQLTAAPMSDLPAAAWWTLALALSAGGASERRAASPMVSIPSPAAITAIAAALAAALAILTRPNLAPAAIVPLALLGWRAARERRTAPGLASTSVAARWGRFLVVAGGVAAASLAVAAINAQLYGSPLSSGYDVRGLFGLEHARPNLARYPALLTEMETPVIWLAVAAPWLLARRRVRARPSDPAIAARADDALASAIAAAALVVVVFACYLFYPGFDAHATLRFLVPALPALFALLATAVVIATEPIAPAWRALAVTAIVVVLGVQGVVYAQRNSAFDTWGEYKYELAGDAIARRLPPNAVLLSMQHSGSVRYYSGREIVRWDLLPPRRLGGLVRRLRRRGYHAYVLLEPWEVPEFQQRFAKSPLGALDWPPAIELEHVGVRIWDAATASHRATPGVLDTVVVPWPYPR
jgi:hypothetical protein